MAVHGRYGLDRVPPVVGGQQVQHRPVELAHVPLAQDPPLAAHTHPPGGAQGPFHHEPALLLLPIEKAGEGPAEPGSLLHLRGHPLPEPVHGFRPVLLPVAAAV